ncbi:MAG: efflux RND transporter periplasmic adaptor subunit [Pseudomonadota bacterium]
MARTSTKTTWWEWLMAGAFMATVLSGASAAVLTLQARASDTPDETRRPILTVVAAPITLIDHYVERESYVGRIEPARETAPAAERSGLIVEILVDEGIEVSQGQVLARMDTRPLEISRTRLIAERTSIEADIELAELTTDRRAKLVGDGWSSGQSYDEARYSITALAARRDALDAQIAQIDLDIEKSAITAPFAGRIARRLVDEGTVIAAGTPIVRVQETNRPQARIGIPSGRAAELSPGDTLALKYQGTKLAGTVAAITLDLESGTRTVPVLIDVESEAPLTMGQVVRLDLNRRIDERGAWVDLTALQEAERGLWSLMTVADEDDSHVIRREAVELLHIQDTQAFVRGTFADGARVVSHGAHRVSVGQQVALAGGS